MEKLYPITNSSFTHLLSLVNGVVVLNKDVAAKNICSIYKQTSFSNNLSLAVCSYEHLNFIMTHSSNTGLGLSFYGKSI